MTDEADATSRFNARVPNIARVYDYWLGGKDNFAADREVGDKTLKAWPQLAVGVRANRAFLIRAVDYLAEQEGIRQFLDIGSGIPASGNTHEVAQSVAPESRIVYVDNDPIVLSHARALLRSSPQGACDYIDGDLRDASQLLELAAKTIDFSKPVAVMLLAVLHWVPMPPIRTRSCANCSMPWYQAATWCSRTRRWTSAAPGTGRWSTCFAN
jgi:hypothetical protein